MIRPTVLVAVAVVAGFAMPARAAEHIVPAAVVGARDASYAESLAAKEIRRYVYVRTGRLLPVVEDL